MMFEVVSEHLGTQSHRSYELAAEAGAGAELAGAEPRNPRHFDIIEGGGKRI